MPKGCSLRGSVFFQKWVVLIGFHCGTVPMQYFSKCLIPLLGCKKQEIRKIQKIFGVTLACVWCLVFGVILACVCCHCAFFWRAKRQRSRRYIVPCTESASFPCHFWPIARCTAPPTFYTHWQIPYLGDQILMTIPACCYWSLRHSLRQGSTNPNPNPNSNPNPNCYPNPNLPVVEAEPPPRVPPPPPPPHSKIKKMTLLILFL